MPTRWSADTALGEAYCTLASASTTITPSPTRGATGPLLRRPSYGKLPSAIIAAKRWKMAR